MNKLIRAHGKGETTAALRGKIFLALSILTLIALTQSTILTPASAQSGGGYDLTWNMIAGGGATFSTGGGYSLGGTIGQSDAGTLSGSDYTLAGGFWGGGSTLYNLMLPLIVR